MGGLSAFGYWQISEPSSGGSHPRQAEQYAGDRPGPHG